MPKAYHKEYAKGAARTADVFPRSVSRLRWLIPRLNLWDMVINPSPTVRSSASLKSPKPQKVRSSPKIPKSNTTPRIEQTLRKLRAAKPIHPFNVTRSHACRSGRSGRRAAARRRWPAGSGCGPRSSPAPGPRRSHRIADRGSVRFGAGGLPQFSFPMSGFAGAAWRCSGISDLSHKFLSQEVWFFFSRGLKQMEVPLSFPPIYARVLPWLSCLARPLSGPFLAARGTWSAPEVGLQWPGGVRAWGTPSTRYKNQFKSLRTNSAEPGLWCKYTNHAQHG